MDFNDAFTERSSATGNDEEDNENGSQSNVLFVKRTVECFFFH